MSTDNPPPACQVRGLTKSFGKVTILRDLNLVVMPGQSVAIIGASGSGKSTLLACILGLIKPDAGEVHVAGAPMSALSRTKQAELRARSIGMVFQMGELLGELSLLENVALPRLLARADDPLARAREMLKLVGIDHFDVLAEDASGGERQRTALARALVADPVLLLADEPTGSLDAANRDSAAELLFASTRRSGCALIVVSHDLQVAQRADLILHLQDGQLTPYTADA